MRYCCCGYGVLFGAWFSACWHWQASAYEVASQASDMRANISDARSVQESLAVEKSSVANPITLRAEAADRLHMAAPQSVGTLSLPADVVVYDGVGNLSLTQSIASVATLS